jgi:mannan endo-1,4-beta-mannosidase
MHVTCSLLVYFSLLAVVGVGCAGAKPVTLTADRAKLENLNLATTKPGFIGASYAWGFRNDAGVIEWTYDAPKAGIYDLAIRYTAPTGGKGYELAINDVGYDGFFAESPDVFSTHDAGKVELREGSNTIRLGKGWAYYEISAITLTPSRALPKPKRVPAKLADAKATPEARTLIRQLVSLYGEGTLTGVVDDNDLKLVQETTGQTPAIKGGDLVEYSPSRIPFGADAKNETERLIEAHRHGHVVTVMWHWNAPKDLINEHEHRTADGRMVQADWYSGFYARATTFDFAKALANPESEDYRLLLRDIDAIAVQLTKLKDAKVPVLWRPLHESDGKWFWWGTQGPAEFRKLWRLLYNRLTVHHDLHNLIWVYTWSDHAWYPGDDVVDVIGIDAYPSRVNDRQLGKWQSALEHFDGKKLIALTEFGGVPDVQAMRALGVHWSYFASWTGPLGPKKNDPEDLRRIYRSPDALNLDDLKRK